MYVLEVHECIRKSVLIIYAVITQLPCLFLLPVDSRPSSIKTVKSANLFFFVFFLMCSFTLLFNHYPLYSHSFLMTLWFLRHAVSPLPPPLSWASFICFPTITCEVYYQMICKEPKLLPVLRKNWLAVEFHLYKIGWWMITVGSKNIVHVSDSNSVGML